MMAPNEEICSKSTQGTHSEEYIQWVTSLQRCHWSVFVWFAVASQCCDIPRNSPKIRTYSGWRSSKVIDRVVKRKRMRICNFLL